MRQEAEERKLLEQQKKQIEKEEEKYKTEMNKVEEALASSEDNEMLEKLKAMIIYVLITLFMMSISSL